jgi:hypothetical protein
LPPEGSPVNAAFLLKDKRDLIEKFRLTSYRKKSGHTPEKRGSPSFFYVVIKKNLQRNSLCRLVEDQSLGFLN